MDFISDLHPSILDLILVRLPLRDAVRTCVLSREWIHKWKNLTVLDFGDECAVQETGEVTAARLSDIITHALKHHQGMLADFRINSQLLSYSPEVNSWMNLLLGKQLRYLDLGFLSFGPVISSNIFDFLHLTTLRLSNCLLVPPTVINGLPFLRNIDLEAVQVQEDDMHTNHNGIQQLVKHCKRLESLIITSVDFFSLMIEDSPCLRDLIIDGKLKHLAIGRSPNLVSLIVSMRATTRFGQIKISDDSNAIKVLGKLPLLEKLEGEHRFTEYLSSAGIERHLPPFFHLKKISLHVKFVKAREVQTIFEILLKTPQLEELSLTESLISPYTLKTDYRKFRM